MIKTAATAALTPFALSAKDDTKSKPIDTDDELKREQRFAVTFIELDKHGKGKSSPPLHQTCLHPIEYYEKLFIEVFDAFDALEVKSASRGLIYTIYKTHDHKGVQAYQTYEHVRDGYVVAVHYRKQVDEEFITTLKDRQFVFGDPPPLHAIRNPSITIHVPAGIFRDCS